MKRNFAILILFSSLVLASLDQSSMPVFKLRVWENYFRVDGTQRVVVGRNPVAMR